MAGGTKEEVTQSAAADGGERREFARISVDLIVSMEFESLSEVVECRALDVSRGGVFIATAHPREEGTSVRLKLHVGPQLLDLAGVVVRRIGPDVAGQTPGMGVMFSDLKPGQAILLDALAKLKKA